MLRNIGRLKSVKDVIPSMPIHTSGRAGLNLLGTMSAASPVRLQSFSTGSYDLRKIATDPRRTTLQGIQTCDPRHTPERSFKSSTSVDAGTTMESNGLASKELDVRFEELQLLSPEVLSQGPNLFDSSDEDALSSSDHPHDDADIEEWVMQLRDAEAHAQAQNESTRKSIQDVGGKPARGTKRNPMNGDVDPIEMDRTDMDQGEGGEETLSSLRDIGIPEARFNEREPKSGLKVDRQPLNPEVTDKKPKRPRRKPKSVEDLPSPNPTEDDIHLKSEAKSITTRSRKARASKPPPLFVALEEHGARYGMDVDGNVMPSRFQWWQRATSRHAMSRESAKQVMVMRKAPRVHRLQNQDYWYKPLKLYTENFVPLIEAEQAHEEMVIRQRLDTMTADKLVAEGYCLNELTATRDSASQAGRPTYTFAFGGKGGRRFTWNRFNPGTSIIISPTGAKADPVKKHESKRGKSGNIYNTGSIVNKTPGSLKISFDEPLKEEDNSQTWRLDIWTSDIVMRRAKEALATLHYNPVAIDRCGPFEPEIVETTEGVEGDPSMTPAFQQTILPGTGLRPVLLDGFIPKDSHIPSRKQLGSPGFFADNQLIQSWCRRQLVEGRNSVEIEGDPHITLNTSQKRAIATMLSSNISLVQGPPGTGKTKTIIEMLYLLKAHWEVPQPILVSAYTNTACDNLAEGMSKRGLKVLRYGSRSRIREDLRKLTLDWYLEQHRDKKLLDWLKAETYKTPKDDPKRERRRRQLFGLERRMMHDILLDVDVVCATCISSRGRLLEVVDFPVVFLDEASMATEPNALIPLTKGCQHAALIGDHKQLPPLVISAKAEEGNLHVSLFERLIKTGKIPSVMLDTQYRMHPAISSFPNKAFYESKLKDGTLDVNGLARPGLEPPRGTFTTDPATGVRRTVTFLDHCRRETPRAKSIVNEGEAQIIYDVVLELLKANSDLKGDDIGIIAPYAGQISCIVNQLRHDAARQQETWDQLGEDRGGEMADIEVHTVDGFEGREKKVIVFSTTRSNEGYLIGFLQDWRRMNVGLTRAKSGLIIVGNSDTLENARSHVTVDSAEKPGADHWRALIRDLRSAGAISEIYRNRDEPEWEDVDVDCHEELDHLDVVAGEIPAVQMAL